MNLLVWTTSVLFASLISGKEIAVKRYYQIKSFDGALLTVGGDTSSNVKIVTEDSHGTDPRQAFEVGEGPDSHLVKPQNQNTFSTLVLGMQTEEKYLVVQESHVYLARRQWWRIQDLGNDKWFIQNVRTGFCMSTAGKDTQPFGVVCDKSVANQTWELTGITRSARILAVEK